MPDENSSRSELVRSLLVAMREDATTSPRPSDDAAKPSGADGPVSPTPDRRELERRTEPVLFVTVLGRSHATIDWSINGAMLEGVSSIVMPNSMLEFTISAASQGADVYAGKAQVVWTDRRRKTVSLKFLKLSKAALIFLSEAQLGPDYVPRALTRPR
jgi:hypothetical protein